MHWLGQPAVMLQYDAASKDAIEDFETSMKVYERIKELQVM